MNEEKERRDSKKIKTFLDIDDNDIETKLTLTEAMTFVQMR